MDNIQYVAFNEYDSPVTHEEAGGDGFKQVLGFVVPLLIPMAAPFITSALNMSGLLTGLIGKAASAGVMNAATGAVMGAANSAATGGNVLAGAVQGGFGGWSGGGGFGGNPVPGVVDAGTKASEIAANGSKAFNIGSATPSFVGPTSSVGLTPPPGGTMVGVNANKPLLGASGPTPAASMPGPGQGVMQAVSRLGAQAVQQLGGTDRVLAMITQMALTGQRNAQMQEAIDARAAEINQARAANQRLYDHRFATSNEILTEARYADPQQGGIDNATDYGIRIDGQKEEALRDLAVRGGYNTGARASVSRKAGLAKGRGQASAFREGYRDAETRRDQKRASALAWLPGDAPDSNAGIQLAALQDEALGRRDRDYGQAFGYGTATVYRPNEDEQWPTDNVGLWTGRNI